MANEDLFRSMAIFNQGLQQFAQSSAINDANEAVQQIRAAGVKESEERQLLQGIANNLTLRLSQTGAPAAQIAQATQAVGPKPLPATIAEAEFRGELGETEFGEAAKGVRQEAFERREKEAEADLQRALKLARAKEKAKGQKTKPLNASQQKELRRLANFQGGIQDLVTDLRSGVPVGPVQGRTLALRELFDRKIAAFKGRFERQFQEFRKETTGAQAAVQELEQLRDAFGRETLTREALMGRFDAVMGTAVRDIDNFLGIAETNQQNVDAVRAFLNSRGVQTTVIPRGGDRQAPGTDINRFLKKAPRRQPRSKSLVQPTQVGATSGATQDLLKKILGG